ncbi:hypothetical protein [Bifidobacterium cuniculi]|uniref:Uncharacterized protein n=1 Tax=Bifidobacterium cuniculi TaxID=1688 RepID=A0A087APP8_9BIFI|nr:hypothetical protein [Bifidobacterium cuniculi]KFI60748.1 hypothetical protein BCUN_1911 [Bifidobacterium cuniculi]
MSAPTRRIRGLLSLLASMAMVLGVAACGSGPQGAAGTDVSATTGPSRGCAF